MNRLRLAPLRALLLAAVLLTAFQFTGGASPAHAGTAFFVAYGVGLEPGATVDILVGDNLCGQVVADAGGDWVATIGPDAPVLICGAVAGDLIHFKLNGVLTDATEVYKNGGTPSEPLFGVVLAGSDAGVDLDTVPPVIEGPEIFEGVVAAAGDFAVIDLSDVIAIDDVDGAVDIFNDAPDAGFPVGETVIGFWAVDAAGNKAELEITAVVTVKFSGDAGLVTDVPTEGVGFGNAAASPLPDFREALIAQGVQSVWVIRNGKFIILFPESPDFVSTAFLDLFADGIPAGEPMLVWAK